MASSTGTYCDICQSRHISKAAEEYCPVCEEAFCSDCKDHHKLLRATKNHQVISIAEYNKLPPFIREIKQDCDVHGDRFDFFCPTHNELCCKRCITTTHSECKGSKVIEDFVEFSKSSTSIDEYKQTLKDVEENIQNAIVDRKNNLEDFENQTQAIRKQIKDKRIEINKHFDNLETKIMNELSTVECEKKQNVQSVIEKLEENKNKSIQLMKNVDAMKKYGSNIQVFMGTTKLQQPILSQERFVRSLQDDESLRFVNLECSISEEINGIVTGIRSFGIVTPMLSETRVRFRWQCDKSAQILTPPVDMKTVDNIKIKPICRLNISSNMMISSCALGKYVLFAGCQKSPNKSLLLQYDTQGKYLKDIELEHSNAFDIVFIDSETVAVTGGGCDFKVHIIDAATLQVKRIIDLGPNNWMYGATHVNNSIIGCMSSNSVMRFNIAKGKDVKLSTIPLGTKNTRNSYIASDNSHLYHSDYDNDSVTCYEFGGKIIWSCKDASLRKPKSICLDSNSNVYVVGSGSDNVVVLSPDGLHSKQLLGSDDGVKAAHAIHYDKSSKRLLVANVYGPACVYQIST
ncbi:Hypothetical predicted protein [Mytilus galloprovincialis]|uniref:B box-type domain-containing protein n=1 Tax=Mytilus galloprovincialis TaxID=29158 RepID=A0A8B6GW78_MYTGA|nr:Hypothetical predicted protein [Mytilus galloprovincialis]